ncbi:MAPEG family protein [Wenzhouxiangella sp. AB-CW3]|uniref:MAPEG family protein n=1 Tax=Wenzhouxiangella sp. AB-CW3 TaxID=2771012 RepID=UPI00168ABAEC|nr:MAPEG family protein [Wenzhouxiangella sp. AB-CW3]QOC22142.1 MAPEG family protein [Wenzhouxiangella sp. AB-CW3]
MPALITLTYASLLALLLLLLSFRVVKLRRGLGVGVGSGGHESLQLAVRTHANFVEYVPLALLLMLLLELGGAVDVLLHVLGLMLLAGRVLHGLVGLNRGPGKSLGRFWGTLLTWVTLMLSAVFGLFIVLSGWLAA